GQRQVRYLSLSRCRVKDELSVYQSYLGRGDRSVKRDVGNTCGDGSAKHRCQLGAAVLLHGHDQVFQCHVVSVILREKRTHRAVDDTVRQDRVLRSLSLSFIEAARDLSYRIESLIVLNA